MLQRAIHLVDNSPPMASAESFRTAMRAFAGSVCVLTAEGPDGPTGCVASSVSSFSVAPPVLMLSLAESSSTARALRVGGSLGISLLAPGQEAVARRFAGFSGIRGAARYEGAPWEWMAPGAQVLAGAVAGFGCAVEEITARHGHLLVLAAVRSMAHLHPGRAPLLYWDGAYRGWHLDDGQATAT
ncbi:MAG: flavin reductase [Burkholderiaceae bacterium]|nr:flavin reductase [Pseudomonadota bacterium]MBS0596820.1 flavin reductase [Pseudomonadota bacterium]MCO5115829.1 flavin reductase family protein [Burkholderiaceae bacterium]MCP5219144.1 flavin reductase [Burkholderiaceae bacterium]